MMYPFLQIDGDTEIVHSEMQPDGEVKVYIEKTAFTTPPAFCRDTGGRISAAFPMRRLRGFRKCWNPRRT